MGKGRDRRHNGESELKEIRRLRLENQKMRKQISALRKQLSRIDIDRYQHLKDMIEEHEQQDDQFDSKVALAELKKKWECHECKQDYLKLIIVPRADATFYFRKCSCGHRTKLKKYTQEVEGIKPDVL
jgi:hypothetical protein